MLMTFMQITFIFILILFIDSVNRVYRVQIELAAFAKDGSSLGLVFNDTSDAKKLDLWLWK